MATKLKWFAQCAQMSARPYLRLLKFRIERGRVPRQHTVNRLHPHALLTGVVVAVVAVTRHRAQRLRREALAVAATDIRQTNTVVTHGEGEIRTCLKQKKMQRKNKSTMQQHVPHSQATTVSKRENQQKRARGQSITTGSARLADAL